MEWLVVELLKRANFSHNNYCVGKKKRLSIVLSHITKNDKIISTNGFNRLHNFEFYSVWLDF